jgi:hypothetical protein
MPVMSMGDGIWRQKHACIKPAYEQAGVHATLPGLVPCDPYQCVHLCQQSLMRQVRLVACDLVLQRLLAQGRVEHSAII